MAEEIMSDPNNPRYRRRLAREIRELSNFRHNTEPFLSLVQYYLEDFIKGVEIFLSEWFGAEFSAAHRRNRDITNQFVKKYAPQDQQPSPTPIEDLLARYSAANR